MKRLMRSVSRLRRTAPNWVLPVTIAALAASAGITAVVIFGVSGASVSAGQPGPGKVPGAASGQPAAAGTPAGGTGSGPAGGGTGGGGTGGASAGATGSGTAPGTVAAFRGIVLPDLLIVVPGGFSSVQSDEIRAISGVRDMVIFDGGQVSAGGRQVSVAGVDPGQFRSWVPLPTASNQVLWQNLADGEFLASARATSNLGLRPGSTYQLAGAGTTSVRFGGAAEFGISGIDVLVNPAASQRLGLARQVAALVSAPGLSMSGLIAQVQGIVGTGGRLVTLRSSQSPAATVPPGPITTYLQLFQASATKYCPAMSWTVLAAIAQIESADGRNNGPSSAGALGPMQFMPSTWAAWGITGFGPPGTPDIMNPLDAVPSAARMLCADGASSGTQAGLRQAIFAYNHATWYVDEVMALAARYAATYH